MGPGCPGSALYADSHDYCPFVLASIIAARRYRHPQQARGAETARTLGRAALNRLTVVLDPASLFLGLSLQGRRVIAEVNGNDRCRNIEGHTRS